MKFEKIIERLEEKSVLIEASNFTEWNVVDIRDAIKIVNQVAEEYGDGWIPCSERLPDESLNSILGWDEYRERCVFVQYYSGRWHIGNDDESVEIIAWQPLPRSYNPKGGK